VAQPRFAGICRAIPRTVRIKDAARHVAEATLWLLWCTLRLCMQ
jgi:hypothetical protein